MEGEISHFEVEEGRGRGVRGWRGWVIAVVGDCDRRSLGNKGVS